MPDTRTPSALHKVPPAYHRSVRNYLLDRDYQLRFTVAISGIAALLMTGLGWMVYHFMREASQVVAVRALDPTDTDAARLAVEFARNDRLLLASLIVFGALLVALIAGYGIILTHRVAGPLFKISLYMNALRDGRAGRVTPLRTGDQLVAFFDNFRAMHDALVARAREEIATLDLAATEAEQAGLTAAADRLRALQKAKEEFVA